jgi:hypothetical protein
MALLTVKLPAASRTLDAVAARLGLDVEDFDGQFGVVPVSPKEDLFAVRVAADRVPANYEPGSGVEGPFSDPKIGPMR